MIKARKMYKLIKKEPRFKEELEVLLDSDTCGINDCYHSAVKRDYDILRLNTRLLGSKHHHRPAIKFQIYYLKGQEDRVKDRIVKKYELEQIETPYLIWRDIWEPLFGDRVKNSGTGRGKYIAPLDLNVD